MGDTLALAIHHVLAASQQIFGQARQASTAAGGKRRRVHKLFDFLHPHDELGRRFIQTGAGEFVVEKAAHVRDDRLMQVDVTPFLTSHSVEPWLSPIQLVKPASSNAPGNERFACVSSAASRGSVITVPPDAIVDVSKPL